MIGLSFVEQQIVARSVANDLNVVVGRFTLIQLTSLGLQPTSQPNDDNRHQQWHSQESHHGTGRTVHLGSRQPQTHQSNNEQQ